MDRKHQSDEEPETPSQIPPTSPLPSSIPPSRPPAFFSDELDHLAEEVGELEGSDDILLLDDEEDEDLFGPGMEDNARMDPAQRAAVEAKLNRRDLEEVRAGRVPSAFLHDYDEEETTVTGGTHRSRRRRIPETELNLMLGEEVREITWKTSRI
ncbi:MCM DNA helicase complex subunit [Dispira simplex]|nr:MCM DNA helicase complex subunit [Dispira simplex]